MQLLLDQYKAFFKTPLFVETPHKLIKNIGVFDYQPAEFKLSSEFNTTQKFIGKRAELFLLEALNQSSQFEVITHSLQIFDHKKTLGEFDFLVRDLVSSEIFQIELVYKVYLYDAKLSNIPEYCWIGPNRRDRFQDKIHKLKHRQFPLLQHSKAQLRLRDFNLDASAVLQKLCFKAMLFKPFQEDLPPFQHLSNLILAGEWISVEDFFQKDWKGHQFYLPQKLNWFNSPEIEQWFTWDEIQKDLKIYLASGRSPLLFVNSQSNKFKLFVANWPQSGS